jgi:hypothetical protein
MIASHLIHLQRRNTGHLCGYITDRIQRAEQHALGSFHTISTGTTGKQKTRTHVNTQQSYF